MKFKQAIENLEYLRAELPKHNIFADETLAAAIVALGHPELITDKPQPDPITGLVPCGCGGKARLWSSDPTQFTHVITDYEAGCTECAMTTGWVRGKQENAVKVWNTAMGWKGGAE